MMKEDTTSTKKNSNDDDDSSSHKNNNDHNTTTETESDHNSSGSSSLMQEFNQREEFAKAAEKAARDAADAMMIDSPAARSHHPPAAVQQQQKESDTNPSPGTSSLMQEFNDRAEFAKSAEKAARDASMMHAVSLPPKVPPVPFETGPATAPATPAAAASPTLTRANSNRNTKSGVLVLNPLSARKAPGAYTATGRMETVDYDNAFSNTPAPHTPPPLVTRDEQEQNDRLAAAAASAMGDMEQGGTQEAERAPSPLVMEGTLEEDKTICWKRKPVMLAMLLVLIIAVVVSVVVVVLQNSSSSASQTVEQNDQLEIDKEPIEEEWVPLVPNMTNATILALEDPFSQQSQAYEWIADDPNWDTYESWRKQQRFAMMCFYYAFVSLDYRLSTRFKPTHDKHECDWLLASDSCEGNDRGAINKIAFSSPGSTTFDGTMPPQIAFLTNLEEIIISYLDMKPLENVLPPNTMEGLPPIKSLKFDRSKLGGSIPSTLGLITSLTSLDLPDTDLKFAIPSQLGLLSNLETLTLSSNGLTGSIPKEIGELQFLKNFDIRNNPDLESPIPPGFCMDGRGLFESLIADWCFSPAECCGS